MKKSNIAETEWKVMEVLWDKSPLYAREIADALAHMNWTLATVKTLINRLVGKDAIGYDKEGKTYRYYPKASREDCVQEESKRFVDRIFGGSKKAFMANFVKSTAFTDEEIEELRAILDQKEGKS